MLGRVGEKRMRGREGVIKMESGIIGGGKEGGREGERERGREGERERGREGERERGREGERERGREGEREREREREDHYNNYNYMLYHSMKFSHFFLLCQVYTYAGFHLGGAGGGICPPR